MPSENSAFPRRFIAAGPVPWAFAAPLSTDDGALLEKLDKVYASLVATEPGTVPAARAIGMAMVELISDREVTAALRLSLLPVERLRDHPGVAFRRLTALFRLREIRELDAEMRRLAASTQFVGAARQRLCELAEELGMSWRLADVLPPPQPPLAGLDSTPMAWLRQQPAWRSEDSRGHKADGRRKLLSALGRMVTPEIAAAFDVADHVSGRYLALARAAASTSFWPEDDRSRAVLALHDNLVASVLRSDLSGLRTAVAEGRSPVVLCAHLGPVIGTNLLAELGIPGIAVGAMWVSGPRLTLVSTLGDAATVNLRFLALAKRMSREQMAIAIFPDGRAGGSRGHVTVHGLPLTIGLGAAALAPRRPSQLFFARTRIRPDHITVDFEPGPRLDADVALEQGETLLTHFYVDRLANHLADSPGEIGTPHAFCAVNSEAAA